MIFTLFVNALSNLEFTFSCYEYDDTITSLHGRSEFSHDWIVSKKENMFLTISGGLQKNENKKKILTLFLKHLFAIENKNLLLLTRREIS